MGLQMRSMIGIESQEGVKESEPYRDAQHPKKKVSPILLILMNPKTVQKGSKFHIHQDFKDN